MLALLISELKFGAERQQLGTAADRQRGSGCRVAGTACRQTFKQKAQRPAPLIGVGAQTEFQRGITAAEPAQDVARRMRIGPRLRMTDRNLAAIGKAGFQPGRRLTVDDRHFNTGAVQIPGRGDADHTGAKYQDTHGRTLLRRADMIAPSA